MIQACVDDRGAVTPVDPGKGIRKLIARKNFRCPLGGDSGRAS